MESSDTTVNQSAAATNQTDQKASSTKQAISQPKDDATEMSFDDSPS